MSPPTPTVSSRAVFLSYAREDAEAARRIADALRAFGVEVWFDQNELRGGDAWDAKIKSQIRECTLFLPVISGRTQNRAEGYFRREWRLGVDRTRDMAHGHAFIIPVVVDDTPEDEALVPEEFMGVQWTRLLNGVPTPEFVAHIKRLLEQPRRAIDVAGRGLRPPPSVERHETPAGFGLPSVGVAKEGDPARQHKPRGRASAWSVAAVIVAAIAAIGVTSYFALRPQTATKAVVPGAAAALAANSASPPPSPSLSPSLSNPPVADAKSIAVLPFENMSADKGNMYFCDGVQEDILTNLGNIRALRVVSRTSVEKYRDTTLSVREIAQQLGVAYVLEGSVQRDGNRVRVTGQLVRAATDEQVWAKAYDRDLTDVFSIQSELAQSIATALQMAISPAEKSALDRKQTTNPAAYDLYLQARQVQERSDTNVATVQRRIELLEQAVNLDATFAAGWGELADAHAFAAFWGFEGKAAHLARAKVAIAKATALAPDDPDIIQDLGTYYYYGLRDYAQAIEQYDRFVSLRPNDAAGYNALGLIYRRQARWLDSVASSRRAVDLDPTNIGYLRNLVSTLEMGNRWDEAITAQQRIVALQPDNLRDQQELYFLKFEATGSPAAGDAFLAGLPKDRAESPLGLAVRTDWADATGRLDQSLALRARQPFFDGEKMPRSIQAFFTALAEAAAGHRAEAVKALAGYPDELRASMATEPGNVVNQLLLGGMEALLGHREAAIHAVDQVQAQMPESRDAVDGAMDATHATAVRAWAGDTETAIAALPRLLRTPNGLKVVALRFLPVWAPVRHDPRVEALIADPKNNAPLF